MRLHRISLFLIGLLPWLGCTGKIENVIVGPTSSESVHIQIEEVETSLGHNIDESGGHGIWCDGCSSHVLPSGEPFVVYWFNSAIKNSGIQFEKGREYEIRYVGEMETGVMGYEGKCINLTQIESIKEL